MRIAASLDGIEAILAEGEKAAAEAITEAMREAVTGLKDELRDQVVAAGLGNRLAKTWRGETYPRGRDSLAPAGYVYSNAPKIIGLFASGATIRPVAGNKYLWIPTQAVPRARGRRRGKMTPEEVEREFNADIYVRQGRGGRFLAYINVVRGKSRTRPGYRPATKGRLAQGREVAPLHVFTLVRSVTGRKLLDVEGAAQRWAARVPALFNQNFRGTG